MSIPYEVDPSLHHGQPNEPRLDDGFSRPAGESGAAETPSRALTPVPVEPQLPDKSDF